MGNSGKVTKWLSAMLGGQLERSYTLLRGRSDFFGEGMRGRISSLLLRESQAEKHFAAASAALPRAAASYRNLARSAMVCAYAMEHQLLVNQKIEVLPQVAIDLRANLALRAKESDVVHLALLQVRSAGARAMLALDRNEEALRVFEELADTERAQGRKPEALGLYHQGIAAARSNLGQDPRRDLEVAGHFCLMGTQRLHQARIAGLLAVSWGYLGHEAEQRDWIVYLARLGCSRKTEEAIMARAQLTLERAMQQRQLLSI